MMTSWKLLLKIFVLVAGFNLMSCSTDQQQDGELEDLSEVTDDDAATADDDILAAEPQQELELPMEDPNPVPDPQVEITDENPSQLGGLGGQGEGEAAAAGNQGNGEGEGESAGAEGNTGNTLTAADVNLDQDRRVWYIRSLHAPIFPSPNFESGQIGNLQRGDHLLVQVKEDWVQIDPNRWIQSVHLTTEAVGRVEPAARWRHPGSH